MKRFLLLVGWWHYPIAGTGDWQGVYETWEEANAAKEHLECEYEWHQIVDLKAVMETGEIPE